MKKNNRTNVTGYKLPAHNSTPSAQITDLGKFRLGERLAPLHLFEARKLGINHTVSNNLLQETMKHFLKIYLYVDNRL